MKRRRVGFACLGLLLLGGLRDVPAVTCSASATATNFGAYDSLSPSALDSTGQVTVTCENLLSILVNYTIRLSSGSSGGYAPRRLTGPGYQLDYNLYTDPARATVWGDGSGGTTAVTDGYLLAVLFPVVRNYTVYGRIPGAQSVAPGSYADTIVVTIDY